MLVAEDTQWESGARFSYPTRPSELQSQFESPEGVAVDMTIGNSDEEDAPHMDNTVVTPPAEAPLPTWLVRLNRGNSHANSDNGR